MRLAEATNDRGGGAGGHEAQTERDAPPAKRDPMQPSRGHSAEQFFSRIEMELKRSRQNGTCFSVLLFDPGAGGPAGGRHVRPQRPARLRQRVCPSTTWRRCART